VFHFPVIVACCSRSDVVRLRADHGIAALAQKKPPCRPRFRPASQARSLHSPGRNEKLVRHRPRSLRNAPRPLVVSCSGALALARMQIFI